jgi:SH3-like domain-containing protein
MAAAAAEFRSVGERPAVMFDAPSQKANKLAILGPAVPLEIVVRLDKWTKVRDATGEVAWMDNSALSERRTVVVTAPAADVRAQPSVTAPVVFEAHAQVLLEPTAPPQNGWIAVRHRDGQQGFVRTSQVWGE